MSKMFTAGNIGLIVSILVLILMALSCHIMNFINPRKTDRFIGNPNGCAPKCASKYAKLDYYYPKPNQVCTPNADNAQVPCFAYDKCSDKKLTDDQIGLLYRVMYESAGNEILYRSLQNRSF
jgi:hypothetical protein